MKRQLRLESGMALAVLVSLRTIGAPEAHLDIPEPAAIVARLRQEHPRLLAHRADLEQLRQRTSRDATLDRWRARVREAADELLGTAPRRYEIPDGLRLLSTSREVLRRVYTLGLAFWLEGDQRYVDRAWTELSAAGKFPDWNPRHFLDTAEMTHAFAIGYDWLYGAWTPSQLEFLRQALTEKGLNLALESYRGTGRYGWWVKAHHNWNQVCNGGIGMGALAIAESAPELAGEILRGALISIQLPMAHFAPDGAWNEGPGYWNYATSYNSVFLAALDSALGTDFGLSQIAGFNQAGMFPLHVTGPLGRTFNYADGGDRAIRAPHLFWLARKFNEPAYAAYQLEHAAPHPLDLLWYHAPVASTEPLPLDKYFRGVEVVLLRSAWNDPNALFVGFKAGDNKANHSNLDLGTFVLDAAGQRWALDLGADDYNLPGYFGSQRWTYYRLRAEGHNTLVLNPGTEPDQDPKAAAPITRFESAPNRSWAIADLTPAYTRHARKVQRGVALIDRRRVLVQDEIAADRPADVWWFMHTRAAVDLGADGRTATLAQSGERFSVRLLEPAGAQLAVLEAKPLPTSPQPAKQNSNSNIRKLAVHLRGAREVRLVVALSSADAGPPAGWTIPIRPLSAW